MNVLSLQRLEKAHPELKRLMIVSAMDCAMEISEVLRTKARQIQLVQAGASQTMNSRHLTGHAADFYITVGGKVRWDWPLYVEAGTHIKKIAIDLGIPIVWGGDWKMRDGPHIELNRKFYP